MVIYKQGLRSNLLKELDMFFAMPTRMINFLLAYRKYMLVVFGVLISTLVIVMILLHNIDIEEKSSLEKLAVLEELYKNSLQQSSHNVAYDKVKKQFLSIIDKSKSNEVTRMVCIAFGKISYDAADFDTAVSMYSRALKVCNDDVVLKSIILNGLAHSYLSNGDFNKAILYFEDILSGNELIMKEDAALNIALIYGAIGDVNKAEQLYKRFLVNFPESFYAKLVMEKIGVSLEN